jgi:hypothetical protein
LNPAYFDEKVTLFEVHRALLNGCFCNNIESSEHRDEARFEKRHLEYQKKAVDEVQVYQDAQIVEERRRQEGKTPRCGSSVKRSNGMGNGGTRNQLRSEDEKPSLSVSARITSLRI